MQSRRQTGRQLTVSDGLWLMLAITLHGLLLLIPLKQEPALPAVDQPVHITLMMPKPLKMPVTERQEAPPTQDSPAEDERMVSPPPPPTSVPVAQAQPEDSAAQEYDAGRLPPSPAALTAARLFRAIQDIEWPDERLGPDRKLGVFSPQAVPANWLSGPGSDENIFNGMVVPGKAEVVDRWLAADGSQNVVINTANGDTLCGQGKAWDPTQPLVEHVIQYRFCGGGGKRSFEMPARSLWRADRNVLANSATN